MSAPDGKSRQFKVIDEWLWFRINTVYRDPAADPRIAYVNHAWFLFISIGVAYLLPPSSSLQHYNMLIHNQLHSQKSVRLRLCILFCRYKQLQDELWETPSRAEMNHLVCVVYD